MDRGRVEQAANLTFEGSFKDLYQLLAEAACRMQLV